MTQQQIKQLEKELWDAADELRANSKLTAAEYKDPVLGLVLLRFAQNKFEEATKIVEQNIPETPRGKRAATPDDYTAAGAMFIPEKAKYDYLANLPEAEDIATKINDAMRLIEEINPSLAGNLPRNYQDFEPSLLQSLVRTFNKDAVKKASGDVFGRIYEYFLMKFSMQGAGAQEGGEFFTPPSLVQLIVNFIEPTQGIIHDPACGSGGMFVQTGYFVKSHTNTEVNEAIKVYGTEQKSNNTKLAKINLAIHGIEGEIKEANSFYADPHDLYEKCDFVMANPPFNVSKIDMDKEFVKLDRRLPWKTPKADNGNYLWVQYFYSYLKPNKGRAGFVMASSATDAGHSEAQIRAKLIETGHVDCVVSVSNNFFYTRSLPCHVWFLDKGKKAPNGTKPQNDHNHVLMIDARNVYRKVSTTINDFSYGQLVNLSAIKDLYRQKSTAIVEAIAQHRAFIAENLGETIGFYEILLERLIHELGRIPNYEAPKLVFSELSEAQSLFDALQKPAEDARERVRTLQDNISTLEKHIAERPDDQKVLRKTIAEYRSQIMALNRPLNVFADATATFFELAKQALKDWEQLLAWFPAGEYRDVEGLCRIVPIDELKANDYSLTPGRYVGVSQSTDEGFDYKTRMTEIQTEFGGLNTEAVGLAALIEDNLKKLVN